MKKHPTDMAALLFGLAFAIAGVAVIVSQTSDTAINGRWVAAMGLILLGLVALSGTLVRSRPEPDVGASTADVDVSSEEPVS